MDKRINEINSYSKKFAVDFGKGIYGKIAHFREFKRISGEIYGPLLVQENSGSLILMERDIKNKKEIIKIHSTKSEAIQSQLEKITGVNLSQYRIH